MIWVHFFGNNKNLKYNACSQRLSILRAGNSGGGHAGLGEKDQAFEWLEKAYKQRDRGLMHLKTDHSLNSLRSDPRFRGLLRRVNLPE